PLVAATRNRGRYDRRTTEETHDVPPGDSRKANHPDAAPPRARRRAPRRHATPGPSQRVQTRRPAVSDEHQLLQPQLHEARFASGEGEATLGTCCTPSTCAGKCGMIADGDCRDTLNCGDTCTPPDTCGGGGVSNQCGCTPNCANKTCGDDGCGGSCGTCSMSVCDTTRLT